MHVCRATIQDSKKNQNPERIPDFCEFFSEKLNFSLFYQNLIGKRFSENFQKQMVQEG
jgi:hypothetical protein